MMIEGRFPQYVVRFVDQFPVVESARELPLAFVHINKTAGTTFTQYLNYHFSAPQVISPPFLGDFHQMQIEDETLELYWGHFSYAEFRQTRRDAWLITFLRDPVQRVISQYRSLHNPENLRGPWRDVLSAEAFEALTFAQRATLDEFVQTDNPFLLGHIQNLQTRFISSFADASHPQFLNSAIVNLEKRFLFFGITEQFDKSIEMFQYQLLSGVDYQPEAHRRNVSPPCPIVVRPATLARIQELVQDDVALYDAACQVFESRLAWVGEQKCSKGRRRAA